MPLSRKNNYDCENCALRGVMNKQEQVYLGIFT